MKFDVVTIFPNAFDSYTKESFINKAINEKLIDFRTHDLRKWSKDKRKTIDDKPFGGGLGMIIKVEPVLKAIAELKKNNKKSKVIVFTTRGKKFNQKIANDFLKLDQLIMICGRYEGVDERILKNIADEKISIGDYVLMGGELPAMIVTETISRLIPGVVKNSGFLSEKNKAKKAIDYPQYTRPEVFDFNEKLSKEFIKKYGEVEIKNKKIKNLSNSKWRVPKDLLSGNHEKIKKYRENKTKTIWN